MGLLTAAALGVAAAVALSATGAHASVTIQDTYYGGLNTYNGGDIVGPAEVFDIKDATFRRIGAGGNTLQVVIDTNYSGVPGTPAADGTGYGALFITPGQHAWNPVGPAPYTTDEYTPGEWTYAFGVPQSPNASSGAADLYDVTAGTVVMSNVNGNTTTAPFAGNPGFYFRQGQAVQFTPGQSALSLAGGTWQSLPGQMVFEIHDNHLLGDNFAFSWAMTCGNDVIQGQVAGIPEPATWGLMIVGFGAMGAMLRRRRQALALA